MVSTKRPILATFAILTKSHGFHIQSELFNTVEPDLCMYGGKKIVSTSELLKNHIKICSIIIIITLDRLISVGINVSDYEP